MLNIDPYMGSVLLPICRSNAWKKIRMLNIDPPMGSVLLPICRSNACKKECKCWMLALPWGKFCYPCVAAKHVKTIQMLNIYPPMGSVLLPIRRSNACKKQYKCWISSLPWGRFCYRYVVPMHVKNNTDVEYRPSNGVSLVTHMSFQCV